MNPSSAPSGGISAAIKAFRPMMTEGNHVLTSEMVHELVAPFRSGGEDKPFWLSDPSSSGGQPPSSGWTPSNGPGWTPLQPQGQPLPPQSQQLGGVFNVGGNMPSFSPNQGGGALRDLMSQWKR